MPDDYSISVFCDDVYGTRVCDDCDERATNGRASAIVEEVDARVTVRGGWYAGIDADRWHKHENERLARWLEVRTSRTPIA